MKKCRGEWGGGWRDDEIRNRDGKTMTGRRKANQKAMEV